MAFKNKKTNRQTKLIDTDNGMVVTRGKRGGGVVNIKGIIYGDGRFDFGQWAHNEIYR